jgi:hypothetical protein
VVALICAAAPAFPAFCVSWLAFPPIAVGSFFGLCEVQAKGSATTLLSTRSKPNSER